MSAQTLRGSIGLAAYRALKARGPAPAFRPSQDRPSGEVLWLHAAEPGSGRAISDLARQIIRARDGLHILITLGQHVRAEQIHAADNILFEVLPTDHPKTCEAFLAHWRPDSALWIWGGLRPNLLLEASARGVPVYLVDAGQEGFDGRRDRWLPEVPRRILTLFDAWLARSEPAHLRLAQLGCPLDEIERVPPLQPVGQTLTARQSDVDEVREGLNERHIWFARQVTREEIPVVLAAHQIALRSAHRLLLILEPKRTEDVEECVRLAREEGLRETLWSDGEMPGQHQSILIADVEGEAGLWFHAAPVSFLGQSLGAGGQGSDPYEAAAHGSAVLYGPNVRGYLRSYTRLAAAGAARIVSDDVSLGNAVARLIAPDQAARMATAAWDVITEGAAATDRVIELVNASLDAQARGMH